MVDRVARAMESDGVGGDRLHMAPSDLAQLFDESIPERGMPLPELMARLDAHVFDRCVNVNSPGFLGLMTNSPHAIAIVGDLIASALNQNLVLDELAPAAAAMERRTIRWLADLAGYGAAAGGHFTSGGTMATLTALKLARDVAWDDDTISRGVPAGGRIYISEERHVCFDKSVDVLGLGRNALVAIPTNDRYQVRVDLLEQALLSDRAAGRTPVAIVGIGGSTATGSVDDLTSLADIARGHGVWFHVDGAYGGAALLSDERRHLLRGIDRADSIAVDPHKWLFVPLDAGAILVKDARHLASSFDIAPVYLTAASGFSGPLDFYRESFEQSRRWRSLKLWLVLQRVGRRGLAQWIDANCEQALLLTALAAATPGMSALCEPELGIACLRFDPGGLSEERIGALHRAVAADVVQRGRFWISPTSVKGLWAFRVNPVNLYTSHMDVRELFRDLLARCDAWR
jgi:glutamate/tyrosine decarboxylase-like PLP-dependent enzyme